MIEITSVTVNCPYCGKENKLHAELYPTWWAAYCDEEVAGCGKLFVYKTLVGVKGIARKVEGEE